MGMFITLQVSRKCPNCGGSILRWQTKDLVIDEIYPIANSLQEYKVDKRMTAEAYAHCPNCDMGVTLTIKKGKANARLSTD